MIYSNSSPELYTIIIRFNTNIKLSDYLNNSPE